MTFLNPQSVEVVDIRESGFSGIQEDASAYLSERTCLARRQAMIMSPNRHQQAQNAVEALSCLYLSTVLEKKGYPDAAQRWRQMADRWLADSTFNRGGPKESDSARVNPNDSTPNHQGVYPPDE